MEEFRVQAKHFAIAKALCGDPGDNVPGVKGIGFKTVSKLFPMLGLNDDIVLQDVLDYAHSHEDESKMYKRIIECKEDVKRNFQLVFLNGNMVPQNQQAVNEQRIKDFMPKSDKMGLIKLLIDDGVNDFDVSNFYDVFNCIEGLTYKTGEV